jgi:inorganic pyrophosphatase
LVSDPIWNSLENLSDINPHLLKEIEHFFQVYKDLENKQVDVEGWGDVNEDAIIKECTTVLMRFQINQKDYLALNK